MILPIDNTNTDMDMDNLDNSDAITNEKIRFSSLQSNFHKLMNSLKENQTTMNIMALHDINETMEILEAKIITYNENTTISPEHSDDIIKNNKVMNDLTPLFIMYRILLDN